MNVDECHVRNVSNKQTWQIKEVSVFHRFSNTKESVIYHRSIFGRFVQFQTKYVSDEASIQEIRKLRHYGGRCHGKSPIVTAGKFVVEIKFSFRVIVIMAMKDYTIRRCVDYRMYESKLMIFYFKYTQYNTSCDLLIRISMIRRNHHILGPFEARFQYNCRSNIAVVEVQLHHKLSQSMVSKVKVSKKNFRGWKASYESLPIWFENTSQGAINIRGRLMNTRCVISIYENGVRLILTS
ncbi:hypothetical protein Ahy_A05g023224 [Arachis hypogaea]|uniref:Uncharacterized protein n=1 Tax=Arachis hypogaea TaxID=3818 RepID=A0A445D2P6_ARAHY|nr:hypothetical protein Ahy_A05g023224 [Arachis hypogaea]